MFASIWSTQWHPIYWLIEITNEKQILQLKPKIYNLIQKRIITLWSKLLDNIKTMMQYLKKLTKHSNH